MRDLLGDAKKEYPGMDDHEGNVGSPVLPGANKKNPGL